MYLYHTHTHTHTWMHMHTKEKYFKLIKLIKTSNRIPFSLVLIFAGFFIFSGFCFIFSILLNKNNGSKA